MKREEDEGEEGADRSMCSDTALCVAMVQAQSELHSSFAAQLANYPQTAMLMQADEAFWISRSPFFFFIAALTHRHESRNN